MREELSPVACESQWRKTRSGTFLRHRESTGIVAYTAVLLGDGKLIEKEWDLISGSGSARTKERGDDQIRVADYCKMMSENTCIVARQYAPDGG